MIKTGIIGATGYAGQQLVWILHNHPEVEITFLSSNSYKGLPFSEAYENYSGYINSPCVDTHEAEALLPEIDLLFLALPHGKSLDLVKKALDLGKKVIDLSADFRLKNSELYKKWYHLDHKYPDLLKSSVYGLPELYRKEIKSAQFIANPGCYTTASILALSPLVQSKLIDVKTIIIDAKSGVSGAGRSVDTAKLFTECNESIKAYSVTNHRHTPEIEQELSLLYGDDIQLSFTPHLIPMNRGILATCYGHLTKEISLDEIYNLYHSFYKNECFIKITEVLPETRWVKHSNLCSIGIRIDERTNKVIVVSAIDNLVKGAAGQAVHNMNLMMGIDETMGLKSPPIFP